MGDLSEEEIREWGGGDPDLIIDRAISEIRRHRAMVKRLEVFADSLDGAHVFGNCVEPFIAAELRRCMKGDSNG